MKKETCNMTKWRILLSEDGKWYLSGLAEGESGKKKSVDIEREPEELHYELFQDVLVYETASRKYLCPLRYLDRDFYHNMITLFEEGYWQRFTSPKNCLEQIVESMVKLQLEEADELARHIMELWDLAEEERMEAVRKEENRLCMEAGKYENCIYIELKYLNDENKLAYHLGDNSGLVPPFWEWGESRTSYVMYDALKGIGLDFRFCYDEEKAGISNITFGELRKYLSHMDRISICRLETTEYSNYVFLKDVPECYDDWYVYGIGVIESEFYKTGDYTYAACGSREQLEFVSCMEIVVSQTPRFSERMGEANGNL